MAPGPAIELPKRGPALEDQYLIITDPVSILRASSEVKVPAHLTMRIRDHRKEVLAEAVQHPGRIKIFRLAAGAGEDLGVQLGSSDIVDFGGSKGVRFPILRFGSYVAALALPRQ
jgi:hypothetical protein